KTSSAEGFRAREGTNSSADQIVNFPTLPYVPTVLIIPLGDSRYWNDFGALLLGNPKLWAPDTESRNAIRVTNSQITVPRVRTASNNRFREDFIWVVMGM